MEVRDGQPALAFVKKGEASIENNFFGHQGLIRAQCYHGHEFGCSNYRLRRAASIGIRRFFDPMKTIHKVIALAVLACAAASCESPSTVQGPQMRPATITGARRIANVRTTAYTHTERGGRRNAVGVRLSGSNVMSAASDWSRYPLGTRFQIVGTTDRYVIDDYGGALIGTNTIDLYKSSRAAMRAWGVRHVDIDVIEWGSKEQSLKVLRPRGKNRLIRRMITGLEQQKT
jgi:3D (Asp-Asp-Asp) domain-containing protein